MNPFKKLLVPSLRILLGWREKGKGKWGEVSIFPYLDGEKMGGKEKERGKVGEPHAPFSSQVFPLKMERL